MKWLNRWVDWSNELHRLRVYLVVTWIILGIVLAVVYGRSQGRGTIPRHWDIPSDSVTPYVRKGKAWPDGLYCPRGDYQLKYYVWNNEFVPRCVWRGED
jgi:hypothetical protein